MINVEYRIFQFSNGCVVQAYMGYFVCNNQRFPLVGITMQARQGMISLIKKTLKLNDRVKVIKECYFCSFTPSNSSQKINFQAEPKSAKHISLVVSVDKIGISKEILTSPLIVFTVCRRLLFKSLQITNQG